MVKRLKCWRRKDQRGIRILRWKKKFSSDEIRVKKTSDEKYPWEVEDERMRRKSTPSKTKGKAIKKAKSYMKKHDVCS